MKKVLVISPDSRHFVREYIENVLISTDYQVTFFTITLNNDDIEFYKSHKVNNVVTKKNGDASITKNCISVLGSWLWLLKNRNKFDVIHIHFMDPRFLKFCNLLLGSKSRMVITFWGSDLLRDAASNPSTVKAFQPWIKKAAVINLMENHSRDVFEQLFGEEDASKTIVLDFGNSTLDRIDSENNAIGRSAAKEKYGLPNDKHIIHLGHNGSAAHQHIKMLDALKLLPSEVKKDIFLFMHFGYGVGGFGYSKDEYISEVEKAAKETGIEYKICFDYLSGNDMADLRLTADMMLYAQTTDAISSSVIETVYAGGLFINPSWLDYSEFDKVGVYYAKYNEFQDIPRVITDIVRKGLIDETTIEKNKSAIRRLKSWDYLAPQWRDMYEDET